MLANQLEHYFSQLINEQKMFPYTHDTFCCALAYRMVLSMEKCLVLNLETKVKMQKNVTPPTICFSIALCCYTICKIVVYGIMIQYSEYIYGYELLMKMRKTSVMYLLGN